MKRIVIIFIGLISVAYGQSSPTSAKTRFVNGLYVGTKLDSYFAAADSNAIYWRADSSLMAKYKGTARRVVFSGELASYIPYSDTASLLSQVVRTFGTQTIGGNKTVTNDLLVNGLTVGKGLGNVSTNTVVGGLSMIANTTGERNTAFGFEVLKFNTTGSQNSVLGNTALSNNITGGENTVVGTEAMFYNTSGAQNTAIGDAALLENRASNLNVAVGYSSLYYNRAGANNTAIGAYSGGTTLPNRNQSGSNNVYIGYLAAPSDTARSNEIVIGSQTTGNGSNTVTIGNSSVTDNYFSGNIRGGAFIRSGGLSTQFLKADGSVDGTSYATAASLSGYLPLSGGTLTGALNGTSATFSDVNAITLSNADSRIRGGTTAGRLLLANSGTTSYAIIYGSAHATTPNTFSVFNDNTESFRLSNTGAATFYNSLNGTSLSMSGGANLATSSGSVGIGTTSPVSQLEVTSGSSGFRFFTSTSTQAQMNMLADLGLGYDNAAALFGVKESTNNAYLSFWNKNAGSMTERMRITSGGDVLINTTTTDGTNKLIVNGAIRATDLRATGAAGDYPRFISSDGTKSWEIGYRSGTTNYELREDGTTRFSVANGGAATFSSSVTATNASLTASTASTSTTTGALVVTGGVGVGGRINAGSRITGNRLDAVGNTETGGDAEFYLTRSDWTRSSWVRYGTGATSFWLTGIKNNSGAYTINQGLTNDALSIDSANRYITALGVYNATVGATNRDLFVDNTGLIGYVSSFRASKKNIAPMINTSWIHELNPVTFNYRKKDKDGKYTDSAYNELEYGLIAEEVEPINKEMVFYDTDDKGNKMLRGVHYSKLIIPLLKEIQDQKKRIDNLEARLQKLEQK